MLFEKILQLASLKHQLKNKTGRCLPQPQQELFYIIYRDGKYSPNIIIYTKIYGLDGDINN